MQLINTEFNFSYYNNLISAQQPDNEFDINQLVEVIKYGYLKKEINNLRNEQTKADRSKLKQTTLPCVTLSGTFEKRNKKHLIEHSGLIQIDIDDVQNYNETFEKLIQDEYTYVAFKSPSGNGIKVIVKANPSIETHLEQFLSLQKYYLDEYAIEIDGACKDIARCMLLSYDPNVFCNPLSEVYPELIMPVHKVMQEQKAPVKYTFNINSNNDIDIIENLIQEIERNRIDITDGYQNWISIGFAFGALLGEGGRPYYHRISKFNESYNPTECDKKYTNLTARNNGAIGLGTIIYIAREKGVEIKMPKRKLNSTLTIKDNSLVNNKVDLYKTLKNKRLELAHKIGKPAFTIFTNKTLDELVDKKPKSESEFLNIYGVSQKKCDKYAKDILPLIINFKGEDLSINKPLVQKYTLPKLNSQDEVLYSELRKFRLNLALNKGMKAFHVFGNNTLDELVKLKPINSKELLQIKGIGRQKLNEFGTPIIELITSFA